MNRLHVLTVLATVVVVLAGAQVGFASSISLISSGGGTYDYGLTLVHETVNIDRNATITLSNLSGVTGASGAGFLGVFFTVSSFTPSSVVYAQTGANVVIIDNPGNTPDTTGTLVVDSSVLTLGAVDFSIQTSNEGTVSGMTQGPVAAAAVPEPASLVLLGTGLLGLVGLARRKWSR